jgi:4-hydroxybenzoyl-CoA reductase subunit beta
METFAPLTLLQPRTLAEASAWLDATPAARALAGGTDLIPNLRHGLEAPAALVDLSAVPELARISFDAEGACIGAGVTLATLATDVAIARAFPILAQAAGTIAGPAHRAAATLGGNLCLDTRCVFYNQSAWWRAANDHCLKRGGTTCHVAPQGQRCHAAYSGDLAPALLVLDAKASIQTPHGVHRVALADLYVDDGAAHLALGRGELIATIHVPWQPPSARSGYRKARVRGAIDFPLAGVAASLVLEGERIAQLRVALTGTNSHPLLVAGVDALVGERVDDALLTRLGKLVQRQAAPMRTTVTAANYRREVAAALTRRLVRELAAVEEA